jgi:hypothetical protein
MKFFHMFPAIAFLVPLVAAAQVASLPVTEQRNAAVGFALTSSISTQRMLKSCAAVPDTSARFADAQSRWATRNKPYVDAADGWMSYVKSIIAKEGH